MDQNLLNVLRQTNAPDNVIKALESKQSDDDCYIWPENVPVVTFFLSLSTQWRVSSMGQYLGLIDASIESNMNMQGIHRRKRPKFLEQIKIMESAALEVIQEKNKS